MERGNQIRLTEELRAERAEAHPVFAVPAARYLDRQWCERERAALFGDPRTAWPRPVAASTELEVGRWVPFDAEGVAAVLTRDVDGEVRAFVNACRHRGTRLVDAPRSAKAIVCPYHGWTYDRVGALVHVPHLEAFAGLDPACRGLVPLPVVERFGLVWLGADAAGRLAPLDADLDPLALDRHVVWQRSRCTRRCNWKLVVEAFLDGYHIRVLHRDSIYPFFLDASSVAEVVGPHIRAVTARRALRDAVGDLAALELRELATPSYLVFPSTVIIEHPDFVSVIAVEPLAPGLTDWRHTMLVPSNRAHETEHWMRSWSLIEEAVFQREDLWVCEQVQRSLEVGATDELLFGALEHAVRFFHDELERAVRG